MPFSEEQTPWPFVLPEDITDREVIYEDEEMMIIGACYSRKKGRKADTGRAIFWMSCEENLVTGTRGWREESSMGVATWIASHIGTISQISATRDQKIEPWSRLVRMTTVICDFLEG